MGSDENHLAQSHKTMSVCNRVHLHIVFVLLYVLCVSLCRCSFVCVRQSIFYVCVTCCDLHVTMRRHYKEEREKARGNIYDLSYVPSKRKEEIKSGTLAVARLLFITSNLLLPPPTVYIYKPQLLKREDSRS